MRRNILLALMLLPLFAVAQPIAELKFVEEVHDFGLIKEEDGPAEFKFEFTNTTSEPLVITNVRASCGCTTPSWTREPVLPGKNGHIMAVYNPRNRPGAFNKTLTVTTNGRQSTIILRIQGKVEPKPRTVEDDFPTVVGGLRTKYRTFNMGKVYNNGATTKEFDVYNASEKPISFLSEYEAPSYIRISYQPQTLGANQRGKILISYDAKQKSDFGFLSDRIAINTNEASPDNKKVFTVYADLNEYFEPLNPETAALAPKLLIEERIHDFGKLDQGTTVNASFMLKNDGKSPLSVRKTVTNCTCTTAELDRMTIAPGESVELKTSFNTSGRRGSQQKSISIYSNDPTAPVQRIILKATVNVTPTN